MDGMDLCRVPTENICWLSRRKVRGLYLSQRVFHGCESEDVMCLQQCCSGRESEFMTRN